MLPLRRHLCLHPLLYPSLFLNNKKKMSSVMVPPSNKKKTNSIDAHQYSKMNLMNSIDLKGYCSF